MIDHFTIKVSDLKKSKEFYEQALKPLGYTVAFNTEHAVSFYAPGGQDPGGDFWIVQGEPTGNHFAFSAPTHEAVDHFYQVCLENGGVDNGGPGIRSQYHEHYYAAFIFDPDHYNIEAVCHR